MHTHCRRTDNITQTLNIIMQCNTIGHNNVLKPVHGGRLDLYWITLHYDTWPFILLSRYMSQRMLCVKGFFPLCNPHTKQTIQMC